MIHPALALAGASAPELIDASLPGSCYLYLTRRDKARQAISMFKAMRSERWWQLAEPSPDGDGVATGLNRQPTFWPSAGSRTTWPRKTVNGDGISKRSGSTPILSSTKTWSTPGCSAASWTGLASPR